MKLSLLKENFLEKLTLASKFTSSRLVSSSVLQGVCLVGENGKIDLYSTNLNYYYHTVIKNEGPHKFTIVLEPKKIIEFLSLISESKIDMSVEEKRIVIESGKVRGEFPLFESGEFPFPPTVTSEKRRIKASLIKKNLPTIVFSASTDETRPVLTGIDFVSTGDDLKMVSTDGFRLSLLTLKKEDALPSMIVPAPFLLEVSRLIDEDEVSFSYSPEEKILAFHIGQHDLYTRLIDGEFPPFEKVIPADKKTTISVDREDLLRNVKLVSIFAREFSSVVVLRAEKDGIVLMPKTGDGNANVVKQDAEVEGEDQKIAFNYKFLLDFLSNSPSKKIVVELLRGDAPAVFKSEGQDNFIHIIMPVRIQD